MNIRKKKTVATAAVALVAVFLFTTFGAGGLAAWKTPDAFTISTKKVTAPPSSVQNVESSPSGAETPAIIDSASAGTSAKDEVVYAKLSADGEALEAYIVNIFTVEKAGKVIDYGDYSSVKNLSSEGTIEQGSGNSVSFDAPAGDFYYQGNIDNPKLPWLINLTYTLDGKAIKPDALAGKNGRLGISIATAPNLAVDSGWFDNYLMQISVTLDAMLCRNIETEDGMIANAGGSKMITFSVMPGEVSSVALEADVTDFSMPGIQFSAVPFEMSIDRPDTSDMTGDFDELADAIRKLDNGVSDLRDGAYELRDGAGKYVDGHQKFTDGLSALASETKRLKNAAGDIGKTLAQISEGLSGLLAPSQDPNAVPPEGLTEDEINKVLVAVSAPGDPESLALAGKVGGVLYAYNSITGQLGQIMTQLEGLANGIKALSDGFNDPDPEKGFVSGLSAWFGGFEHVANGASGLGVGATDIRNGLSEYAEGVDDLKEGTAELRKETADMPSLIEEKIDEMMSDYDKSDYIPTSFASEKNGEINAVQFVITTEKIELPETKVDEGENNAKSSLLDRLFDLFKK